MSISFKGCVAIVTGAGGGPRLALRPIGPVALRSVV